MKKAKWLKPAMAGIVLLYMAGFLPAQAGRGKARLSGIVANEAGQPIVGAIVKLEYEKSGLKDQLTTNRRGEFVFMGLGSGNAILTASAEGYLPSDMQINIKQLDVMPSQRFVLKEDLVGKARVKDAASLAELEKGNQLYSEQKWDEALAIYQKFAQENPTVFLIYFNIGDCFREKGEIEKAVEQYNIGLEKAKEKKDLAMQAKAMASIGEIFLRKNDFTQAQDYFKKSIELNPKDEILAYNVAEICFANNKPDEALQYYQMATVIKPTWPDPFLKLGYTYLNKGDIENAKLAFAKFLELNIDPQKAAEVNMILDSLNKIK